MKFLRFINWRWNKFSNDDKITLTTIAAIIFFIIYATINSIGAVFSVVVIVAFVIFVIFSVTITRSALRHWKEYNKQMEREQQSIVDKLAGR
jgi:fatty acid desaturase